MIELNRKESLRVHLLVQRQYLQARIELQS